MYNELRAKAVFASEAELCRTFQKQIPAGWIAYNESCGFDMVLVRISDGYQIGIEAKLTLNAKVIDQIVDKAFHATSEGPDFRAILIPYGCTSGLLGICAHMGVTVIEMRDKDMFVAERARWGSHIKKFKPDLPDNSNYWGCRREWYEFAPEKRLTLPAYVPDVAAGKSSPVQLSEWKIKAIKICIILERRGYVTRKDFDHVAIDHKRWFYQGMNWLAQGESKGRWFKGSRSMDLRREHPKNYVEIEADFDKWGPADMVPPAKPEPKVKSKRAPE